MKDLIEDTYHEGVTMLSNYPPGVTDSDIDAHFGDDDEEPMPTLDEIDEDDPAWDGNVHAFCGRPTVYCDCI